MGTIKGWYLAGSHPWEYEHGLAEDESLDGKRVAFLRCGADEPGGFGTLMQMIAADEYREQRVRFSAVVKTLGVEGWAGLWMRVDGPVRGVSLAFDNMQQRKIRGTSDWSRYEVVLDVAQEARAIGFGVLLERKGELRVVDFRFEPVSRDVPTTDIRPVYPKRPQNLDLSEEG
ncbi:MAG TPA: hypothetical protein VHS99_11200 [Chloroflexota bacterium]|nr:hypothetical protein [Chloroflexota bacterium]